MKISEIIRSGGFKLKSVCSKAGFSLTTFWRRDKTGNFSEEELNSISKAMNISVQELKEKMN